MCIRDRRQVVDVAVAAVTAAEHDSAVPVQAGREHQLEVDVVLGHLDGPVHCDDVADLGTTHGLSPKRSVDGQIRA
eukprot:7562823-Pyramimonas_sp.AAC.1